MFAGDLRYRTQPVLGKLANIAAKKDYTGASFYLMAKATNFTKIERPLRVSYQAHQRHSPYSLCYLLGHKTL
jgi:hypothetical protein